MAMIEVKHLRLITAIEKTGSLSKAAQSLFLTQSALSQQLRQLEESVGTPLFKRTHKQLHFTAAGKLFREKASQILSDFSVLEEELDAIRQTEAATYIHGYSIAEAQRLQDQASTVADFIHWDSDWPSDESVLEIGCGVGAQTSIIASRNPETRFTAVDISKASLEIARQKIASLQLPNVNFQVADVEALPYSDASFDHVFVCFLLEHLSKPALALQELQRVLKPGGSITVVEGDHGSTFFYPDQAVARKAVAAQVKLQRKNGGNANIGRELYPLLAKTGFQNIRVSPRQIYVDDHKPALQEGFIRHTFTAMIEGIAEDAVAEKVISTQEMQEGIGALLQTAESGGTFSYTFFKAKAWK